MKNQNVHLTHPDASTTLFFTSSTLFEKIQKQTSGGSLPPLPWDPSWGEGWTSLRLRPYFNAVSKPIVKIVLDWIFLNGEIRDKF